MFWIPLQKWLYLLNAGGDGGNDQHEGEGDHHPVLEVGHLEQEGHESNDDEDCLLEEHAEKMVLNLPGGNARVFFHDRKSSPPKNYFHFSHAHISGVVNKHRPLLDLVLKKVFFA